MNNHWKYEPLGSIAKTTSGGTPNKKNKEYYGGTIPWVRSGELNNGIIYDSEIKITKEGLKNSSAKIFPRGTLLIALYGATIGKLSFLGIPAATNQAICAIFENEKVILNYLYYFLLLKRPELIKQGIGGAQPNISQTILKKIIVPYPVSKTEQEKIVSQIEESFSQLDSAVATLNKTKQQLEIYRQAVLKEAFDGNLTNSGKAKEDILKNYIEKPKYGTSKKCSYLADNTYKPVYRIPNINTKTARIDHTDIKYAHFDKKELETIRLQNNDLLIIRSNGSVSLVGRVALVTDDDTQGTFAGYLMRLRIINQQMLFPKYLLWYLQSKSAREYIESKAKSTSGVNNINSEEISNLTIPYYNFQSQKAIVEAIESRISIYDSIQQVVTTSLQQSEAMRQSILKQAIEGNDGKEL